MDKVVWSVKEQSEGARLAKGGLSAAEVFSVLLTNRVLRYGTALERIAHDGDPDGAVADVALDLQ